MIKTLKRIFLYVRSYITYFIPAVIFALISVVLSLLIPIFIGRSIDFITGENNVDFSSTAKILIILMITVAISGVSQWIMTLCTNKLSFRTVRDIRTQYFRKLNSVPISYIDSASKGDYISRATNDIEIISDALNQGFTQFFTGIITILGTLIFMLFIDFRITLIVVFLTPVSLFVAAKITSLSHNSFAKQSAIRGQLSGFTDEMLKNQNIVKAFGQETDVQNKFDRLNNDYAQIGIKATFFSSITNPSTRFINGLIYAFVGLFGALRVIAGGMSVGTLVSFLSYANQYTKPFNEISGVVSELQNAIASAQRVFQVCDAKDEPDDSKLKTLQSYEGSVRFENVWFSYTKDKQLIQDVSLDIHPGQRIAIVGPTGCGKTTIINLLMRFYDVNSGAIYVCGENINEITRDSLRSRFGMVLQDTWLFSATIHDNISYGKPDASRDEVIAAAKSAHAHGFIKRLPDGYDTVIGENGGNLSQGQKQLLTIARIMLTNPPMLILDEATSSIDIRTEIKIQQAFEKLMKGKTSFIIAHRLSTIRNTDMILVMRDGNIIEHGKHHELMSRKGFYYTMYTSATSQ
ncbi:MAG: ABC transporter ATP-binding protein [Oscillospiraceae bacterium]|nr:ABC transporter ATP-binding protein [Oscillospiraceae bacterium]